MKDIKIKKLNLADITPTDKKTFWLKNVKRKTLSSGRIITPSGVVQ